MKRAFITGCTGAIGMALIDQCVQHNIECYVMVRQDSPRLCVVRKHTGIHIIMSDLALMDSIDVSDIPKIDAFFHLGWQGTTGIARNDETIQMCNVEYTLSAVRVAHKLGCHTFIGAGSQAEYGICDSALSSDTPTNPITQYGKAKLTAGIKSRDLCNELGIKHIWTRILSVYGPYDTPNSLISSTLEKIYNNKDLAFTKGEQDWDYIYCADAAQALIDLAEAGRNGCVYPIGSGQTKKLADYLYILADEYAKLDEKRIHDSKSVRELISSALGKVEYSNNQVMHLCADISGLTKDTGFVPEFSFEDGIRATIRYFLSCNMV